MRSGVAAVTFRTSPISVRIIIAVVAVALLAFSLMGLRGRWIGEGVRQEQAAEGRRLAAARAKVAKREVRSETITTKARKDLAAERGRIQTVTRTIVQKVPVYVTPAADDRCVVPLGFVRLHDAAASGSAAGLSRTAGGPLDAPSGLPLSAVGATVVENYGVAFDWRAEALSWRDWYDHQKSAWDRP